MHEVDKGLRILWAALCSVVYKVIAFMYELFMNVSQIKILTQTDIKPIYNRVTLILAIIMIFYVTFEVVKYIISPDTVSDKEKGAGNIVKKMIIVVGLIAAVPTIFSKAYDLQTAIFKRQVLSKIILGKQNVDVSEYGKSFSANIFSMFYRIDETLWDEDDLKGQCSNVDCNLIVEANLSTLAESGEMPFLYMGLTSDDENKRTGNNTFYITFDGLLALVVGIFVCWILLMYTIDAGSRIAQLAFLQIIAPIPIIGYLSPEKDGMFQKWYKQCFSAYIGLFLRLSIVYIILLICGILDTAYQNGDLFRDIGGHSFIMQTFIYITLLVGLLSFGKNAPKMLEEIFPKLGTTTGSLGLGLKDRSPLAAKGAARAIGTGIGAISTGAKNARARFQNTRRRNKDLEARTGESAKERRKTARKTKGDLNTARGAYKKQLKDAKRERVEMKDAAGNVTGRRKLTGQEIMERTQKSRDELTAAQSAYADAMSKKSRSVLGNTAAGLARGAKTGAKSGFGATSLGEIRKKVQEGQEAAKKDTTSREEWLNSGGYDDRARRVAAREQKRGVTTAAGTTERQIQAYEGQIKAAETLISRETEVGTKVDASKSTASSRIDSKKLKTRIEDGGVTFTYKKRDGTEGTETVAGNQDLVVAYGKYEKDAEDAQKQATAAGQALEALKAEQLKIEQRKKISELEQGKENGGPEEVKKAEEERKKIEEEYAAINNAIADAQKAYDKANIDAADAENLRRRMHDKFEEYAVTRALQGKGEDGNVASGVSAAIASLQEAGRDSSTVTKLKDQLEKMYPADAQALFEAFQDTSKIQEFETLDNIQKALKAVADERAITVSGIKGSKDRLAASDQTAADKANDAAGKQ